MKQVLLLLSIVLLFFTTNTNAQLKPAQSQYLVEKGVLINPSFEQGYKGWIITGCTKSLVSETPYLNKSLKLTCTNETFSIKQVSTALTSFSKQQGAFDLQIKTTASGVNVSSITNSVRDNAYSVINSTEFKRFKEIGFIVGDTDNGIEVYSDTNFTGEIILDSVKLGLGNLTQEISAAHFVGSLTYESTGCVWAKTTLPFGAYPIDNDCVASEIIGKIAAPLTKIPAIAIPNVRTDGYYSVTWQGLLYSVSLADCKFSWSESSAYEKKGITNTAPDSARGSNLLGNFRFETTGDKELMVISENATSGQCNIYGRSPDLPAKVTVHFFPDSKNTIVSQDTELTAKTANSFSADITSAGAVSGDSYDFINGSCVVTDTSLYTCTLNDLSILNKMACVAVKTLVNRQVAYGLSSSSTEIIFRTTNISGTNTAADFSIICNKHDDDLNKSQTIVGSFEQIRSDDLSKITAREASNIALTNSVTNIPFNTTSDLHSEWDGDELTAKYKGFYIINGATSTLADVALKTYKDTGAGYNFLEFTGYTPVNNVNYFTTILDLNVGDKIAIRTSSDTTINSISTQHFIKIARFPDFESAVANLMQGQTTKCQIKVLQANVSGTGNVPSLSFNNLTIGKKYSYATNIYMGEQNSSSNFKEIGIGIDNGTKRVGFINTRYPVPIDFWRETSGHSRVFSAVSTDLDLGILYNSNMIITGSSVNDLSYIQLCELPDTVIETTEFN